MKIIGGTDKDKEDEARNRADALAKAIIKMLPQHLSHRELLAALSSVLAAAFAEDGTREGVLGAMRDLTASVLAEFGRSSGDSAWDSATFQKGTAMIRVTKVSLMPMQKARRRRRRGLRRLRGDRVSSQATSADYRTN